mgnify:CR=1 FL=1
MTGMHTPRTSRGFLFYACWAILLALLALSLIHI